MPASMARRCPLALRRLAPRLNRLQVPALAGSSRGLQQGTSQPAAGEGPARAAATGGGLRHGLVVACGGVLRKVRQANRGLQGLGARPLPLRWLERWQQRQQRPSGRLRWWRAVMGVGLVGGVSAGSMGLLLVGRGVLRARQPPLDRWSAPPLVRRIARYSPDPSRRRQARLVLAAQTSSPRERLAWLAGQGWGKRRGQRTEPSLVLSLRASAAQQEGNAAAAKQQWHTLLQQFPFTPASAEARYWLGQPGDALHEELRRRFPAHPASLASALSSAEASGADDLAAALHLARWGPRWVGAETLLAQLCRRQGATLPDATAAVLAAALEQVNNPAAAAACRGDQPRPAPAAGRPWDALRQLLLQGNWRAAAVALAAHDHPGQIRSEAARARFWRGVVAERLGDAAAARQHWRSTAALSPWSYYGWRSRVRLGDVQWPRPLTHLPSPPAPPLGPRERHDGVAWLWNLGFEQRAWEYWRHWRGGSRPETPDDLWVEGQLRIAVDDPWMGLMLLDQASWQGAAADGAPPRALERLRHPLLFSRVLTAAAQQQQLDPALLLAVARQESRFRPAQRSHTGALGLLQIMPATGAELLAIHGRHVLPGGTQPAPGQTADPAWLEAQLLDAGINAALGARYLASLQRQWRNPILAIASYNAGPGAVARWGEADVTSNPELWIEAVPYPETRNYVKRVLGSWWAYSLLYAWPPDPPQSGQ